MPEENLLDLAKARDLNALKQLLNQTIKPNAAQIHDICIRKDCLQISIESINIPDQLTLIPLVQHTISQLQVSSIHTLEVYGHTIGDELPHWMQQLNSISSAHAAVGSTTPSSLPTMTPTAQQEIAVPQNNMTAATANGQLAPPPVHLDKSAIQYSPAVEKLIQDYSSGRRDFQNSNFNETDLQGINLTLANLQESQLVWANLSQASLGHANLTSAQLRHANLSNANLQGAKLQGADLQGANLTGANLSWAELRGVNFTGADLTEANLLHANLERVTMPDGTYLD
jgi:hypothetical protein